jgi:tol-pal system protein YbgF
MGFTSCATVWEAQRVRQDVKELREYVDSIKEKDLSLLKENTDKDLTDLRQKQADLLVQIEETRTRIAELQGEIDQLTKANEDIKKELEATKEILNSIQEDLKKATEKPKDEEELYKQGLGLYNAKEYVKARETFKNIIENFPNGKYVDNAHYWTGECYYAEGNFLAAIDEYGTVIEKYPNSPKGPAALLKAGMAFQELKRKKEARAFYLRVINEYPKSEQAGIARKKLDRLK